MIRIERAYTNELDPTERQELIQRIKEKIFSDPRIVALPEEQLIIITKKIEDVLPHKVDAHVGEGMDPQDAEDFIATNIIVDIITEQRVEILNQALNEEIKSRVEKNDIYIQLPGKTKERIQKKLDAMILREITYCVQKDMSYLDTQDIVFSNILLLIQKQAEKK